MKYSSIRGKEFRDFKEKYKSLKELLEESFSEKEIEIIKEYTRNEIIETFENITQCRDESLEIEFGNDIEYNITGYSGLQINIIHKFRTEIEYIAYIKKNEFLVDYIEDNYKDLMSLYGYVNNKDTTEMVNMTKNAIPLTASQLKRYKNYQESCKDNKKNLDKQRLLEKLNIEESDLNLSKKCDAYICRLVDRYIDSNADVAFKQGVLTVGLEFIKMYKRVSKGGKIKKPAFLNMVNCNRKAVYYADAKLGVRKATISEIEDCRVGVFRRYEESLSESDSNKINIFGWAMFGDVKYLKYAGLKPSNKEFENLENNLKNVMSTIQMMNQPDFEEEKLPKILANKDVYYEEEADDELEDYSYIDLFKLVKKGIKSTEKDRYLKMARDIVAKGIKYGDYVLSEKQYYIVIRTYKILTSQSEYKNYYNDEAAKMIEELEKSKIVTAKSNYVASNIMEYAKKNNKLSEKQYNIIKSIYDEFIGEKEKLFTEVDGIDFSDDTEDDGDVMLGQGMASISDLLGGGELD